MLFWFGLTILFCFNAMVFGQTLAGIAEVNFQLTIPLQQWVAALNLPFTALALILLALALYLLTPENYLTIRQALPGAIYSSTGGPVLLKLFHFKVARSDRLIQPLLAPATFTIYRTRSNSPCFHLPLA